MRIKAWVRRHQIDSEPANFDQALETDRQQAAAARNEAQKQIAEVRRIRQKSDSVHRGMEKLREENHFSTWLFQALRETR